MSAYGLAILSFPLRISKAVAFLVLESCEHLAAPFLSWLLESLRLFVPENTFCVCLTVFLEDVIGVSCHWVPLSFHFDHERRGRREEWSK